MADLMRSNTITIRVTPEEKAVLLAEAREKDRSISWVIRNRIFNPFQSSDLPDALLPERTIRERLAE